MELFIAIMTDGYFILSVIIALCFYDLYKTVSNYIKAKKRFESKMKIIKELNDRK